MKRVLYFFLIGIFLAPAFAYAEPAVTDEVVQPVTEAPPSEELPEAVTGEIVIESEDEFNSKIGGVAVNSKTKKLTVKAGETDISILDEGPPKTSKKDIKRAKDNQNCDQIGDGVKLNRNCKGKVRKVIEKKLIGHELTFFSAGGVDTSRRFSRYGIGGASYVGAWNFSNNTSFLFGSDILFSPMQGAGDQYYVELNRVPKGTLGVLFGLRYTTGIFQGDILIGGAFAHTIEFDSIPIKGNLKITPGNFVVDLGIDYKIFDKDWDLLSQSLEALYRWKYVGVGVRSEYLWVKADWFIWQWALDGEAVAEYYFSKHFTNENSNSDWGAIRLQGGRSTIDEWIGRAELQFKF